MHRPHIKRDHHIVLGLISMLAIPAMLTLRSIERTPPALQQIEGSSPLGYTWSLLFFALPVLILGRWLATQPPNPLRRQAFWITVAVAAGQGFILDVVFANSFFVFNNRQATLGIQLPGYDFQAGWGLTIPIEEFAFYFLGFMFILLLYIWCDEYWFRAYQLDNHAHRSRQLPRVLMPYPRLIVWWIAVLAGTWLFKRYGPHPYQSGIPGYAWFLACGIFVPSILFWRTAKGFINWRAVSFTMMCILFISVMWEVTLAMPYQWWGYRPTAMLGMMIGPWGNLPAEAPLVWVACTWMTALFYETARVFLARRERTVEEPAAHPARAEVLF